MLVIVTSVLVPVFDCCIVHLFCTLINIMIFLPVDIFKMDKTFLHFYILFHITNAIKKIFMCTLISQAL